MVIDVGLVLCRVFLLGILWTVADFVFLFIK